MKPFTILVKDLKQFIKEEEVLYASGDGKRLYVKLHAGPNVARYIVKKNTINDRSFVKKGDVVKYFNELY